MNATIIQKQIIIQNANFTLSDPARVWNVSIEATRFYPIFGIGNGNWNRTPLKILKSRGKKGGFLTKKVMLSSMATAFTLPRLLRGAS
jgi:hypothetical protein